MSRLIGIRNGYFLFERGDTVKCPQGIEVRADQKSRRLWLQFPGSAAILELTEHDQAGTVYCALVSFLLHHGIKPVAASGGSGVTVNRAMTC